MLLGYFSAVNTALQQRRGRVVARRTAHVLALLVVQLVVVAGIGLLITGPLHETFRHENAVNAWFVGRRTDVGNFISNWASHSADTGVIVAYVVVAGLILRWVLGRWRESLVIAVAVAGQAAVFLACTVIVKRERPEVPKLDVSPPTSSYPSGHVGAAVAFWATLALVLAWHQRAAIARAACWLLLLVPALVAWSRLYRGMHHLSDVIMGVVDGLVAMSIAAYVLAGGLRRGGGVTTPRVAAEPAGALT